MNGFDWFAERVEIAREDAPRSFFGACPVCGGGDPLHVTEKNGKALVKCFSCSAGYAEVVKAIEDAPPEQQAAAPRVPTVTRRRRAAEGEQAPPPAPVDDPLQWYADYCGVSVHDLMALPVTATGQWINHQFSSGAVTKDRLAGSSERRWTPAGVPQPRLWPSPTTPMPEEVWLAEGETDTIVLRIAYGKAAYTAGSASQPLSVDEFKSLSGWGVKSVVVAYDSDKAGLKARSETLENAREAGLLASVASLGDPLLGAYKDWRDRNLSGDTSPIETTATTSEVWGMEEIAPAENETLLLNWLHPDDHTILFGDGGTGKGVIAAWWVAQLAVSGMNVLILDYEHHATHEWRPRLERFICGALGHTVGHSAGSEHCKSRADDGSEITNEDVLKRVSLWAPWEPIWDIASGVKMAVLERDVDYIVVDSVVYACGGEEAEKSVTATKYSKAIAAIGKPVLSLAHVTKQDADPSHPFGSTFWSAGARITIAVAKTGGLTDPRKLEVKKVNQGGDHRPKEIDWVWVTGNLPHKLEERDAKVDLKGRILENLMALDGHGTKNQITQAMDEDGNGPFKLQTVSNYLKELKDAGKVSWDGKEWHLSGPSAPVKVTRMTKEERELKKAEEAE